MENSPHNAAANLFIFLISPSGGHIPPHPPKSSKKGWKVFAKPYECAQVGQNLPTRKALKFKRPSFVGQVLPTEGTNQIRVEIHAKGSA